MAVHKEQYAQLVKELEAKKVTLIAVSKTKPVEDILKLYQWGQRDFGENYVQELVQKQKILPADIRWHFIGHLQRNKVKAIVPFVHLIHGVDSAALLEEINKQAHKAARVIDVLLQVHIAADETKFGLSKEELKEIMNLEVTKSSIHTRLHGMMGMASLTDNLEKIRSEFRMLKDLFDKYKELQSPNMNHQNLSMGMSGDYKIAVEEGSTMVRIGSLIFGDRK